MVKYDLMLSRNIEYWLNQYQYSVHLYAAISCMGEKGETLALHFLTPQSSVPDNEASVNPVFGKMFVPAEQFPWYVDLLRNETKIFAWLRIDKPEQHRLTTLPEPTGQGEPEREGLWW